MGFFAVVNFAYVMRRRADRSHPHCRCCVSHAVGARATGVFGVNPFFIRVAFFPFHCRSRNSAWRFASCTYRYATHSPRRAAWRRRRLRQRRRLRRRKPPRRRRLRRSPQRRRPPPRQSGNKHRPAQHRAAPLVCVTRAVGSRPWRIAIADNMAAQVDDRGRRRNRGSRFSGSTSGFSPMMAPRLFQAMRTVTHVQPGSDEGRRRAGRTRLR